MPLELPYKFAKRLRLLGMAAFKFFQDQLDISEVKLLSFVETRDSLMT